VSQDTFHFVITMTMGLFSGFLIAIFT
jgi:hypothetical protein